MNDPVIAIIALISAPAIVSLVTLIVLSIEARKWWRLRQDVDRIMHPDAGEHQYFREDEE